MNMRRMHIPFIVVLFSLAKLRASAEGYQSDFEQPDCDFDYDFNSPPRHCTPRAIPNCPPGTLQVQGSCLRTIYSDHKIKCPMGSELVGSECVHRVHVEPSAICPAGYHMTGTRKGNCDKLEVIAAETNCEPGFRPHKGQCIKEHKDKVKHKCPHGYRQTQTGCLQETVSRAHELCPSGYVLSPDTKNGKSECMKEIIVPAGLGCKKDYLLVNGDCVKQDRRAIVLSCPKGFVQEANFCIQRVEFKADLDCPAGYHLKGILCEAEVTADLIPVCPKGYEMQDGMCLQQRKHGSTWVCPKGSEFVDGDCITRAYVANELVCPEGSWLKGRQYCVSSASVPAELRCPPHYTENDGECHKYEKRPNKLKCPHGYGLYHNDQECSRIVKHKAEAFCDGRKSHGQKCESIEAIQPEISCSRGELNGSGDCVRTLSVNPEGFCRKGFTLVNHQSGICQRKVYVPSESVCPHNSDFKMGKCAICTSLPPEIACPKKYFINASGACQQTLTARPTYGCPAGYVIDRGMCFPSAEGNLKKAAKAGRTKSDHHENHFHGLHN